MNHKKVLLRDRKRHTARAVVNQALVQSGGVTSVTLSPPSPEQDLVMGYPLPSPGQDLVMGYPLPSPGQDLVRGTPCEQTLVKITFPILLMQTVTRVFVLHKLIIKQYNNKSGL